MSVALAYAGNAAESRPQFAVWDPETRLWGFMDRGGKLVLPFRFHTVYGDFAEGVALVAVARKWGIIDESGQFILPPIYDDMKPFSDGLALVATGESWETRLWGYVNKKGDVAIPLKFARAESFSEKLAYVTLSAKDSQKKGLGYIDQTGKWVIHLPSTQKGFSFRDGLALCGVLHPGTRRIARYGFINRRGKMVVPAEFDYAGDFSSGLAPVVQGVREDADLAHGRGKGGFINKHGELVIDVSTNFYAISYIDGFHEAFARLARKSDGKWGFMNRKGDVAISPKFDSHWPPVYPRFRDGLAAVWEGGLYGYINTNGQWVIPPIFEDASEFSHGLAHVTINEGWAYIDRLGNYVWGPNGGFRYGGGDGMSISNAIAIADAKSHEQGVRAEYKWLTRRFPTHEVAGQSLSIQDGHAIDIIVIKTGDGHLYSVYFDISEFFGKE